MKVSIKPVEIEDADFFVKIMQNKEYKKHYLNRLLLKTKKQAEDYIRGVKREEEKGKVYCFTIYYGKEKAGILDLYKINNKDKRSAIGYGVAYEFWGKGIATKAVKLGLDFLKKKGLHTIEATIDPKNEASCKVLEKTGFEKIGTAKDYYFDKNKYVDRVLYWKIL
jgi:ribosomal-protein-alanine N-acetyltransferase